MQKIKFTLILLLLTSFSILQAQEITRTLLKDKQKTMALVEKFILKSEIDSLRYISTFRLQEQDSFGKIQAEVTKINSFLANNNFKNFEEFHNGAKTNEDQFVDGKRYYNVAYRYTPKFIKDSINPHLLGSLKNEIAIKIVNLGDIWTFESLEFKTMDFDTAYDIEDYIENFFQKDTIYKYVTRITMFKKGLSYLSSSGSIENLDLKLTDLERLDRIDINPNNYYVISIQRKETTKNDAGEDELTNIYLELMYSKPTKVLVSNSYQYGFYEVKKKSNLSAYIKEIITSFIDRQPE